MRYAALALALGLGLVAAGSPAVAQPAPGDIQAAASAFEEGQRAQLRRDYARAAELFEIADRAAPSAAALRSAIRNHQAAGHEAQAATLALRATERYPSDAETRALAEPALAALAPRLGRFRVACSAPCALTLDRAALTHDPVTTLTVFVAPGDHTVEATWPRRAGVTRAVVAVAGQSQDVSLDAPPETAPEPAPAPTPGPAPAPVVAPAPAPAPALVDRGTGSRRPLPPAVFWVAAGLTVAAAGVLVWSGLDTLSARDAYAASPTEEGFFDGEDRETRTNILIGTAAALGVATAAVGLFLTDWGRARAATRPTVGLVDGGALFGVVQSY